MTKQKILSFLLFFSVLNAVAQDAKDVIPKIIPPSPNAAALEKFSTIPVDYSTGIPSISYPIWSWQRGKLQFNVGLNYHAGGHKVDDMPSNVGLGWALTGIGRVSRTVRGLADDDPLKGFMNTPSLPALSTYQYNGNNFYYTSPVILVQQTYSTDIAITEYNSPHSATVRDIVESQLDGEQDIFSFSFSGGSGRFIIDKNQTIVPLEHTMAKIEMIKPSGWITAFKITDDKGIVYKFEHQETQNSVNYSNPAPFPPIPTQNYTAGWLLTKIIDPTTQDSIVITHANTAGSTALYETSFSESQSIQVTSTGFTAPSVTTNFSAVGVADLAPVNISFPDGSSMTFEYDFSRADLLNSKSLTRVLVKNYRNELIKKFRLNYSYFTSSSSGLWSSGPVSGNDFTKRLRLDGINEIASDSSSVKPTVFTYNPTLLNRRGSFHIDYWGYNVDPARNNLNYAPEVPTTGNETLIAPFIEGADRKPDSVYSKAAILEKIQYPTGGFTRFEYENNRAFASFDYYEDKVSIGTLEWDEPNFGTSEIPFLGGRIDTPVDFLFKMEELGPRGLPDPGCLAEGQDITTARFEITSTDAAFSTYVEFPYSTFLGGYHVTINLPLNKNYKIKFIYNSSAACAYMWPFKAVVTGTFSITPQDKLAGGLRVKRITSDDGTGNKLTREYYYNHGDGHSSAVFTGLTSIPNYGYYRTSVDQSNPGTGGPTVYANFLNRSSNPTNTLTFNGNPLIYTRVIEKEADGSSTERRYDSLIWAANGGEALEYPYMPVQDFPNFSGLLKKVLVKDNVGILRTEQTITYNKVSTYLLNQAKHRNLKTGTIATAAPHYTAKYYLADQYFMYTSRAEVTSDETKTYAGGEVQTVTKNNTYKASTYYLESVTTTNSKNEQRTEEYTYSVEGVGTPYTNMNTKNMLAYNIGKRTLKTGVVGGELTNSVTNYQLYHSGALPMPGSVQSSLLGGTLQTDITFDSYDAKGNPLQYTAKDGIVTAIVWGYKQQYPVAKIVGKTYADAISLSGLVLATVDAPASDAAMRTELNKLRALTGCFVTTLTYKPLVGATSETDQNGITSYYEYDSFNRLAFIRDKDNRILKKLCYNYSGQPVDCSNGTLAAWKVVSSTCQVNGSGQFTGNKIVVEKDMNPASATYNQTRNVTITNDPACVCSGADMKVINGICEKALKVCVSSVINRFTSLFTNTYYYQWSDNSVSANFQETSSTSCMLGL